VASHQVAIRRSTVGTPSLSDLHVDSKDGANGAAGPCTLYYSMGALSDTAVFETTRGGAGVSVGVLRPGWCCAMCMHTNLRLHGSVWAGGAVAAGSDLRIVTYPLKDVDALLQRAAADPAAQARLASSSLSDDRLLSRMGVGVATVG